MSPITAYRRAAVALHHYDRLSFWLAQTAESLEAWIEEILKYEKKGG